MQIGNYSVLGQGRIFGVIPIPLLFLIGIAIIIWYILNQTRLGRSLYAIGGNEEAAVAAGIRVERSNCRDCRRHLYVARQRGRAERKSSRAIARPPRSISTLTLS